MVGILMNASVQITNKKRVRRVTKKNDTPNTAVNIKETIQNRINPKKLNNEEKQCSIDFKGL